MVRTDPVTVDGLLKKQKRNWKNENFQDVSDRRCDGIVRTSGNGRSPSWPSSRTPLISALRS